MLQGLGIDLAREPRDRHVPMDAAPSRARLHPMETKLMVSTIEHLMSASMTNGE